MIARSPGQLKEFIRKKARENGIPANVLMQYYMLERLLERVSVSRFRHKFILKGGLLISAMVGLNTRTTMDMDVVVEGLNLTREELLSIFNEICALQVEDNISFEITHLSDILEKDDYPGIRIWMKATYLPITVILSVDVTTGGVITPDKMDFPFPLLLDDRTIGIFAYNLETVLAEKLETALTRDITSLRIRDYYDLYILEALYSSKIDRATLRLALERTTENRESQKIMETYPSILRDARVNNELHRRWNKHLRKMNYPADIPFEDVCDAVQRLMDSISS